jgi:hypothetical protein
MRHPKDRDFLETREGLLFCVIGYLHPPDRYTAYLKYTPASAGKWARGETFYRRELPYYHVDNVVKTVEFLQQHYPHYVWFDPPRGLRFSFVPESTVARYYVPEERLAEILPAPRDPLEDDVSSLVKLLTRMSGVPPERFGITGSVLLGLHNPSFSDIDLLVYGRENTVRVQRAAEALRGGAIQDLPPGRRRRWREEVAARFGLAAADAARIEARRWNYFLFRGRYVSVHPTRLEDEIREAYGDSCWRKVGVATIEAMVSDATESVFLPAVYRVADLKFLEGEPRGIREVISFEGLYCQVAEAGQRIVASGEVEEDEGGACRLVVGAASAPGGGFIRLAGD